MNDRDRAVKILIRRGVPIEPNEPTETLIKKVVKQIRRRRSCVMTRTMLEHYHKRYLLQFNHLRDILE